MLFAVVLTIMVPSIIIKLKFLEQQPVSIAERYRNKVRLERGERVHIHWPDDKSRYPEIDQTVHNDGKFTILYVDG